MTRSMSPPSALLLILSMGLLMVACTRSNQEPSPDSTDPLPKVSVVTPERRALVQTTRQPGEIHANAITAIYPKVPGFVEQLLVDIGDHVQGPRRDDSGKIVEPGQLLLQLMAPELQDELRQKEAMFVQSVADVEQARASVEVAKAAAISIQSNIALARAKLVQVDSERERWQSESNRITALAASGSVTQKLSDETRQQAIAADAQVQQAAASLQSAEARHAEAIAAIHQSEADLRSAEAKVEIANAEVQRLNTMCQYLEIRAPYDGILSQRHIDVGSFVSAGRGEDDRPLLVLVDSDRLRLVVDVPEKEAGWIQNGCKVSFQIPSLGNRTFQGQVARTSWALNPANRTLRCEVDLDRSGGELRPGMYANADITLAERENALTVPLTALVTHQGKSACWSVTSAGIVEARPVELGIQSASHVEVVSGLDGSEKVIAANAAAFQPGQRVTIAK